MFGWGRKNKGQNVARKLTSQEAAPRVAPDLPLDLMAPDTLANPYPVYAWLRDNAPVAPLAGGGFLLTRHADILAAFTNPALRNAPSRFSTLNAKNADRYVAASLAAHIPPFQDGRAHKATRQMITRALYNSLDGFEAQLAGLAQDHVATLGVGADLIMGASRPFALSAMCAFCGIPTDPSQMKAYTQAFFHLFAPLKDPAGFAQINESLAAFRAVIAAALEAGPRQGTVLAELAQYAAQSEGLSTAHVIDACLLIFADGTENVEAGAALCLAQFAEAGVLGEVSGKSLAMDRALEEALRLDTPGQIVPRVAVEQIELHGQTISRDMPVFLALGSANRDGHAFEDADRFQPQRDHAATVTFGKGRHSCIGAPLARMQLSALLAELLRAGYAPVPGQHIRYQSRFGHRWPERFEVRRGG